MFCDIMLIITARSTFAANVETNLRCFTPQIDFNYNLKDLYKQFGGTVNDTVNLVNFSGSQTLFDWVNGKHILKLHLQKSDAMIYEAEQTLLQIL